MYTPNRGNSFLSVLPPVTRFLLITNVAIFLFDMVSKHWFTIHMALFSYHIDTVYSDAHFQAYRIVTHMFMHGGLGHLFFNMFALYMFGRVLEQVLGSQRFFILYFLSGLGAAALQLLIYYFQVKAALMVGASGAIMGVLAAFAVYFPNVELMLIFLPIPIKAKYFVPIFMVLELYLGVANFQIDNIAHFAHLGGAIVGFILVFFWKQSPFRKN